MIRPVFWSGIAVSVALTYAVLANSTSAAILALAVGLTTLEVLLLVRIARGFTAVVIPVVVVNLLLSIGYVLWDRVAASAEVSAEILASSDELRLALTSGLWFTAALTLGALLVRPSPARLGERSRIVLPAGALVAVGFGIFALRLYGLQGNALRSPEYLGFGGPRWAVSISGAFSSLALLILCYAVFQPGRHRVWALIGLTGWALLLFGSSSRQLALLPGMLLLGRALAVGPTKKRGWIFLIPLAAVLTIVLTDLVLTLRANPGGVGVLTLGGELWSNPASVWAQFDPRRVVGNILFSSPLIGRVATIPTSLDVFWTSVSPLPGAWTDWPSIAPQRRINFYTPYAALGELAAQGRLALVGYGFATGAALSFATRVAAGLPGIWRTIGALIVVAAATLFCVTLLQYNLRNVTRLLWYALAGLLLLRILVVPRMGSSPVPEPAVRDPQQVS